MTDKSIQAYESAYLSDFGFESVMVAYRQQLLLDRLNRFRPNVVVEIGCGSKLLYEVWQKQGGEASSWIIVEPAEHFYELARSSGLSNLHVIKDFFENAVDRVLKIMCNPPCMVICSSLLHEVPSSTELLTAILAVMGPQTRLHINVPNSESLHRRLALVMGLIPDTKTMSERNKTHMQHRVYDKDSLKAGLAAIGLNIVEEGGYLIKPFTHAQMQCIVPELGEGVMNGLFKLGEQLPELASEIWVEAIMGSCG